MVTKKHDVCTIGRRKESVARVYFYTGKGQIVVNGKSLADYFSRETSKMILKQPFPSRLIMYLLSGVSLKAVIFP